jgi:hypothetical protein
MKSKARSGKHKRSGSLHASLRQSVRMRKPESPSARWEAATPYRLKLLYRTIASLAGVLLLWFIWQRSAFFALRPLDVTGTLHPLLWPWFSDFTHRYTSTKLAEDAWIGWCRALLIVPLVLASFNLCFEQSSVLSKKLAVRAVCSQTLFWLAAAVCLLICRFPLLLGGPSNVDEAEFTASATKLFADPLYFRAVDCNTSGPLNIFPLMLPALFGFSPDYASTRAVALLFIFSSMFVLYRAIRLVGRDDLARIAVLPALGFFCLVTHPDFVPYNSETVSLLLISLTVLVCIRTIHRPLLWRAPIIGLGALVSAAFFAKMQALPIVGAAAFVALACVLRNFDPKRAWKPVVFMAAGAAPLPALVVVICAANGVWRDFWTSYFLANWGYTRSFANFFSELPKLAAFILDVREFQPPILGLLVVLVVSVYAALRRSQRNLLVLALEVAIVSALTTRIAIRWFAAASDLSRVATIAFLVIAAAIGFLVATDLRRNPRSAAFGSLCAALLAGSAISLYTPHNTFPHYLFLWVIPIFATMGWLLMRQQPLMKQVAMKQVAMKQVAMNQVTSPETAAAEPLIQPLTQPSSLSMPMMPVIFGLLVLVVAGGSIFPSIKYIGYNFYAPQPALRLPEGNLIRSLSPPNSSIVVWGWRPEIYLSAGLVPATRDTQMGRFWYANGVDDYYRQRFLRDIQRTPPGLFIDALDVSCCYLNDRSRQGFETIPAISSYVREHYVFVGTKYNERFYLRRDLPVRELDLSR